MHDLPSNVQSTAVSYAKHYYVFFHSLIVSFGTAVWSGASLMKKIMNFQKAMLRIVTLSPPRKLCYKQIFTNPNTLTTPSTHVYTQLKQVFINKE